MAFKLGMHDGSLMHGVAYMLMFVSVTVPLIPRSQWIGRKPKQYLSYGNQIAHDGRPMHGIYVYILSHKRNANGGKVIFLKISCTQSVF